MITLHSLPSHIEKKRYRVIAQFRLKSCEIGLSGCASRTSIDGYAISLAQNTEKEQDALTTMLSCTEFLVLRDRLTGDKYFRVLLTPEAMSAAVRRASPFDEVGPKVM